jgi:hypothetical protein
MGRLSSSRHSSAAILGQWVSLEIQGSVSLTLLFAPSLTESSPKAHRKLTHQIAGKSSLINSLLDFQSLAHVSNGGTACTCAAIEYHYHDRNDFVVKVEYFTWDQLRAQMAELLQSYRQYHLNQDSTSDEHDFHIKARDTFKAMFPELLANDDDAAAASFLVHRSEEDALETLMGLVAQAGYISRDGQKAPDMMVVPTLNECAQLLKWRTSADRGGDRRVLAPWPFIRCIKVYSNATVLSNGLILVDLPGLHDLNSARLKITERYVFNCDEIFVICGIGRATSNAGVLSAVNLARGAKLSNVGIVCTSSENIAPEEAEDDWKGEDADRIRTLRRAIADNQKTLGELKSLLRRHSRNRNLAPWDQEEFQNSHQRSVDTEITLEDKQFELKRFIMKKRNDKITADLAKVYRNSIPDANPRIFCVSNTDYWEYRNKPKEEALRYLELSGIIDMRRHVISIVAESKLRAATKFMKVDIPLNLGSIKIWVQSGTSSGSAESKSRIRDAVRVKKVDLQHLLTSSASQTQRIKMILDDKFEELVYGRKDIAAWTRGSSEAARGWSWQLHHSKLSWPFNIRPSLLFRQLTPVDCPGSYAAWCRHYGDHTTRGAGTHNWNEQAMRKMVDHALDHWEQLAMAVGGVGRDIATLADGSLNTIITGLGDLVDETQSSIQTLCHNLELRRRQLVSDIGEHFETFERDVLRLCHTEALSSTRTSIMVEQMEPAYHEASCMLGSGSHERRKNVIEGAFGDPANLSAVYSKAKARFDELAAALDQQVRETVSNHLCAIKLDMDSVRDATITLESEREPEFRTRMAQMLDAVEKELRIVHRRAQIVQRRTRIVQRRART